MPQQPVDYDALAAQHGGVPNYDAIAAELGGVTSEHQPDFRSENQKDEDGNAVVDGPLDALAGIEANLNPVHGIGAIGRALIPQRAAEAMGAGPKQASQYGPINALNGILAAQNGVKAEADAAWTNGDHLTAIRKYADWLVPILGPAMDQAIDKTVGGQPWRGVGEIAGLGFGLALPKAIETASIKVPTVPKSLNPQQAAAVAYGEAQGVPLDMATATGNSVVRSVQKGVGNTPLGYGAAEDMRAAQVDAMQRVGRDLADQAYGAPTTAENAGTRMAESVQGQVEAAGQFADRSYDAFRTLANDASKVREVVIGQKRVSTGEMDAQGFPIYKTVAITEKMASPVDLRGVKLQLKPVYEQLKRQLPITQQQASKGFKALENIVNGRDFEPLAQVESDLGAVKSIARGADLPELRTVSQGLAAKGVAVLQRTVDRAAAADPKMRRALTQGRAATADKFAAEDVWIRAGANSDRFEPVKLFERVTAPRDANISLLRDLQKNAATSAQVARAWIERRLAKATNEGELAYAKRIQNEWNDLGPETKKILFPRRGQVEALDHYFRLQRMLSENPNPSGTATTSAALASTLGLFTAPLTTASANASAWGMSKILNSPRAVQLFTRGGRLMLGPGKASATARAAGMADVLAAMREAGVKATPAAADDRDTTRPAAPRGQSLPGTR